MTGVRLAPSSSYHPYYCGQKEVVKKHFEENAAMFCWGYTVDTRHQTYETHDTTRVCW
jgi:hypothetical protein